MRPRLVRTLTGGVLLGLAGMVAGPSLAAEAPGAAAPAIGMPQLRFDDPLVLSQAVWVLVLFGALYWVMSRVALPPVQRVIAERTASIRGELDAARDAKAAADAEAAELEKAIGTARAEAQAKIREATEKAKAEAAALERETSARLAERLREAEARIAATSRSAQGEVQRAASEATVQVVATLTGTTPPADRAEAAVTASMGRGAR